MSVMAAVRCGDFTASSSWSGNLTTQRTASLRLNSRTMSSAEEILARIQRRMKALDIKERAIGELAGSPDIVRNIRRGVEGGRQRGVTTTTIKRIAPILGTTPEWLLEGIGPEEADAPTSLPRSATVQAKPMAAQAPQPQTDQTQRRPMEAYSADLPILGTAAGSVISGVSGLIMERRAVDYILRPPRLAGVPNAYAIRIVGKSMEPLFRAGDLCIVDPNDVAAPEDRVIVQTQHHAADPGQTYVKILRARTISKLVLQQLNPPAVLEIPREYVSSVHRVLTLNDLFETTI